MKTRPSLPHNRPWPCKINDRVVTPREYTLMHCLIYGPRSDQGMADKLGITKGSVKVALTHLYKKFDLNRYTISMYFFRDHQRVQAIALNEWIRKYGEELSAGARYDLDSILARQVLDYLKERPNDCSSVSD